MLQCEWSSFPSPYTDKITWLPLVCVWYRWTAAQTLSAKDGLCRGRIFGESLLSQHRGDIPLRPTKCACLGNRTADRCPGRILPLGLLPSPQFLQFLSPAWGSEWALKSVGLCLAVEGVHFWSKVSWVCQFCLYDLKHQALSEIINDSEREVLNKIGTWKYPVISTLSFIRNTTPW